jgi:hypothetical protein
MATRRQDAKVEGQAQAGFEKDAIRESGKFLKTAGRTDDFPLIMSLLHKLFA